MMLTAATASLWEIAVGAPPRPALKDGTSMPGTLRHIAIGTSLALAAVGGAASAPPSRAAAVDLVGAGGSGPTAGPDNWTSGSFRAVKPRPAGSLTIDPAAIVAGSPDVAVTARPDAALIDPTVTVASSGGATVDRRPRRVRANAETTIDVAATTATGPTVITATLSGLGADGAVRSTSDTIWVDSVAGTPVVSATGTLDLELRTIDLRASRGLISAAAAAAARAETLGRTDVDTTLAPSALCAGVCIAGTVKWTDSAGGRHPVRKAPVEIWDKGSVRDTLVTTVTSDATGAFAATIDNLDADGAGARGRDIYLRVVASGPGFAIGDHYIQNSVRSDVATGTSITATFVANNVTDNNTAFSLQNAMVVAGEYLATVRSAAFPFVHVTFPSVGGGSYYDGVSLNVDGLDRWDWDVMLHEYGHFIADVMDIEDNPGGSHSGSDNLSDTHGNKSVGVRLAFGEGWPTYFAVSALREMNTASLNIPNIGDTSYQDTEDQVIIDDLEAGGRLGEDNERTVMSVLWDLYDTPADGLDRVALGTGFIWNLLDASPRPALWTLGSAYNLFSPGASAGQNDRNCIFTQQNVSPTISGPALTVLGATAASPTINWTRGNGGTHPNKLFEVQYRDATDGALLHTSGPITVLTYTAPAGAWSSAKASSGGNVNVTVVGTQIDAPLTGPYRSCKKSFSVTDSGPPAVTIDQAAGQADPGAGSIHFTAVFSEPVSGFTTGDVTLAGNTGATTATVAEIAPNNGTTYDVVVTGMTTPGTVSATIAAGRAVDGSSNANTASTSTDNTVAFVLAPPSYRPLVPGRLLDSRPGGTTIDGADAAIGLRTPTTTTQLTITGRHGVPTDATAAVLNITVTATQAPGYATVWPCGTTQPNASNLNFDTDTTIANNVITKIGTAGQICIATSAPTHLIVDLNGYHPAGSSFTPLVPGRLLDSRPGGTTIDGADAAIGLRTPTTTTQLTITGRHGVPTDATAAVLNITVTATQAPGYATVWPCGTTQPNASNLNFDTDTTIANNVITKIGTAGQICIATSAPTHLIVDLNGYHPAGSSFTPLVPGRLLDSRPGGTTIDGADAAIGLRTPTTTTQLTITGRHGVPTDATAAVLNITVTATQAPGYATVWPCGTTQPNASNLNFDTDTTIANNVITKIGTGGQICIATSAPTHLIVDLDGYHPAGP